MRCGSLQRFLDPPDEVIVWELAEVDGCEAGRALRVAADREADNLDFLSSAA
jgi:hypothetical protein